MKTCLYQRHVNLGAKMVDFFGWEMPLHYKGIIQEHLTVRQSVGLFDVSHMARILVEGSEAEPFLDYLCTNQIEGKKDLTATYTVWCSELGTCVDDVIVYKKDQEHFFVIVNASNREKDLEHLKAQSQNFHVQITPLFDDGILALQGPKALSLIDRLFPKMSSLPFMRFLNLSYQGQEVVISRTGYTGEEGVEMYASSGLIPTLWDRLLEEGMDQGIQPIGLGARDTLRLEKGYALYGHELSEEIYASETVSAWTIKKDKKKFIGSGSLDALEKSLKKRGEYGIILIDKGVAREGYRVMKNGECIGRVTSGTFSPSLNQSIALVLSDKVLNVGDEVDVEIRQQCVKAKVVNLPFY
ncbi:MAG: glycine cleavage system protein T [Chlamydiales bacterium 38-26]|nr:glycine cleavage system aminomethyltransferase GcvT [Chlamydiales bacterium]OJV11491.1 MAG: glycine cleavage system protein T [Chlamydiales bacterium 38-26]